MSAAGIVSDATPAGAQGTDPFVDRGEALDRVCQVHGQVGEHQGDPIVPDRLLTRLVALVTANLGTATAEFPGIAAGSELLGISRYIAVPLSALLVSWLVMVGSFHPVEHVLMALAAATVGTTLAPWGLGLFSPTPWTRSSRCKHLVALCRLAFCNPESGLLALTS